MGWNGGGFSKRTYGLTKEEIIERSKQQMFCGECRKEGKERVALYRVGWHGYCSKHRDVGALWRKQLRTHWHMTAGAEKAAEFDRAKKDADYRALARRDASQHHKFGGK